MNVWAFKEAVDAGGRRRMVVGFAAASPASKHTQRGPPHGNFLVWSPYLSNRGAVSPRKVGLSATYVALLSE